MSAALLALAERCEAATGPDRELDKAIFDALPFDALPKGIEGIARYTASLDAAMTLVPEGALWEVDHKLNIGPGDTFEQPEGEPARDFRAGVGIGDVPAQWTYGRNFSSSALALCAAALRARAAQ
jgi:hypothetical protein